MLFAEILGITLTIEGIETLASCCEFFVATQFEHKVRDIDDSLKIWHFLCQIFFFITFEIIVHHVSYKEQASFGVVDNVVHLFMLEFM